MSGVRMRAGWYVGGRFRETIFVVSFFFGIALAFGMERGLIPIAFLHLHIFFPMSNIIQ